MANKKLIIGIVVGVVVIGAASGIGYYYYNKNKKKGSDGSSDDTKGGGGTSSGGTDTPTTEERSSGEKISSNDTIIKIGSYGKKVAMYQAWLNWKYGANLTVDGKFGDAMMKAVRKHLSSTCGVSVVGVGDTECRIDNNYKVNKLFTEALKNPEYMKYLKADKGAQKVFSIYK